MPALRGVTIAALALVAGCAGSPAQEPPPPPPGGPLAIVGGSAGNAVTALDPDSLAPSGPRAELGEYHDAWAFSPDGSRVAFGISAPGHRGRIAIRVLERGSLRVAAEIEAGAAAQALGWLASDRIAAYTIPHFVGTPGSMRTFPGELLLADTGTGRLLARRPFPAPMACTPASAVTPTGFAVLVGARAGGRPRLALLDAEGRYRTARLARIPARVRDGACGGIAIDAAGRRAFVVAAGAPVAEVDLRTLAVRYSAATVAPVKRSCLRDRVRCVPRRSALWLGDGRLAVFGEDVAGRSGHLSAGVRMIEPAAGIGRTLDARAADARLAGSTLLAFGGASGELRGYALDGTRRFRRFAGGRVADVQVAGGRVYARARTGVVQIDPATGETVSRPSSPPPSFELLEPPPG